MLVALLSAVRRSAVRRVPCRLVIAGVVGASVLSLPSVALAGSDTVWNGYLYASQGWKSLAPRHSLNSVNFSGSSTGVDPMNQVALGCVNAWNADGSGWAGSTYCSWPSTSHPYCGCQLRYGYAAVIDQSGLYDNWVYGYWAQYW
jgi:hypothetical protein